MSMDKKHTVYLDHAAATPMSNKVLRAMQPYFQEQFYNPSALYLASKHVKAELDQARQTVARVLGVRHSEIIFTAGGTEANNLAIHGVMGAAEDDSMVVVSAIEHDSVLKAAERHAHQVCPVSPKGQVEIAQLKEAITDETVLVSVMHVNNELGTIQPIQKISQMISDIRAQRQKNGITRPLYLHCDASQSANYVPLLPQKLGVDLMTVNGGKLYGPKQTGVLYVRSGVLLRPQLDGGGQESGWRSGTENIAGCVGFATALEEAVTKRASEVTRLEVLQKLFVTSLTEHFPTAQLNSRDSMVNFVHVSFPGVDNERLVMALDERGVQCAVGSACSASSDEPSHVLTAIGMSSAEAETSVRFTMGRATTQEDIEYVIVCLQELVTT